MITNMIHGLGCICNECAERQYQEAMKVSCPFPSCLAPIGQRCNGVVFPQYPHTSRYQKFVRTFNGEGVTA